MISPSYYGLACQGSRVAHEYGDKAAVEPRGLGCVLVSRLHSVVEKLESIGRWGE